jgi:tol-pal system protein YbgF
MSRRLVSVFVLIAIAALARSAAAQSRREMQMMADIRMLQEQNQQLQNALTQLGDTLKAINSRLDEQSNTNRKAFADQKLIVDQFGSDLRIVRERVDETNVRITSLSQEMEALRLAIPQFPPPGMVPSDSSGAPISGGVPGVPAGPPVDSAASPGSPVSPPGNPGLGISPQRLFDTAWSDYTLGQWALCVSGFDTYLKTFPRNDRAAEAQFYIGECHYNDGKFNEAIEAYNRTIDNYPRGARIPDAYYKRGVVLERLGQLDRARESYEGAIKNFPDSEPARLSKQRLDSLSRVKPPQ